VRSAVAAIPLIAVLAGCGSQTTDLPAYGVVPDFVLTDQTGKPFGSKDLAGKIWVADFVFTTCQGPCPRMSSQFRQLQQQVSADPSRVRFVSFTIDPVRDSPAVLADYGKKYGADPSRWVFLTGSQAELNKLSVGTFYAGRIDGSLTHSTRFALVDSEGRVRGFYDSSDPEKTKELVRDIGSLAGRSS